MKTSDQLELLRESVYCGAEAGASTCDAVSYFRSKLDELKDIDPAFSGIEFSPYVESLNCPLESVLQ